jgi:hypothetical protein
VTASPLKTTALPFTSPFSLVTIEPDTSSSCLPTIGGQLNPSSIMDTNQKSDRLQPEVLINDQHRTPGNSAIQQMLA